jgi:Carboxypeptidase regulatory-like domain
LQRSEGMKWYFETPIAVALCMLPSCDGGLTITGVVRDSAGQPIDHALVRVQNADERSDANGCFRIFEIVSPRSRELGVRVEAVGYKPFVTRVKSPGRHDFGVVLAALDSNDAGRTGGPSGCDVR